MACKTFMQGPLWEDPARIWTRFSVQDLYRITQSIFKIFLQVVWGRIWAEPPQDLLTRACASHEKKSKRLLRRDLLQRPVQNQARQHVTRVGACTRSCEDLLEDFSSKISKGPSDQGLYKIKKKQKIFSQGPAQGNARTLAGFWFKIFSQGACTDLAWLARRSVTRTSTISSHKDNRFARAVGMHMAFGIWASWKKHFTRCNEHGVPDLLEPAQSKFILKSRASCKNCCHPFITRILNINAAPQQRDPRSVRTCASETRTDNSEKHFMRESSGKMSRPKVAGQTLRKLPQAKMHMDISSEQCYIFYGKANGADLSTPAVTLTVGTPQCGHAVWGIFQDLVWYPGITF